MNPTPLRPLSGNRFFAIVLPVLAISSFAACNSVQSSAKEQHKNVQEEKIITIPAIKNAGSVNNLLHQKLPFRYTLKNKNVLEIQSNITRLHIKGDSCWLEYISNAVVHKVKDGVEKSEPREITETTDTVLVR